MVVSEITVQDVAQYLKLDYSSLTPEEIEELMYMLDSSRTFLMKYTGLTLAKLDESNDFVIAVYVLCQDMYDNRTFYVDKNNLNRVIQCILDMHCINLL